MMRCGAHYQRRGLAHCLLEKARTDCRAVGTPHQQQRVCMVFCFINLYTLSVKRACQRLWEPAGLVVSRQCQDCMLCVSPWFIVVILGPLMNFSVNFSE